MHVSRDLKDSNSEGILFIHVIWNKVFLHLSWITWSTPCTLILCSEVGMCTFSLMTEMTCTFIISFLIFSGFSVFLSAVNWNHVGASPTPPPPLFPFQLYTYNEENLDFFPIFLLKFELPKSGCGLSATLEYVWKLSSEKHKQNSFSVQHSRTLFMDISRSNSM